MLGMSLQSGDDLQNVFWLMVEAPICKIYIFVKLDHFPKHRGEHETCFLPTTQQIPWVSQYPCIYSCVLVVLLRWNKWPIVEQTSSLEKNPQKLRFLAHCPPLSASFPPPWPATISCKNSMGEETKAGKKEHWNVWWIDTPPPKKKNRF